MDKIETKAPDCANCSVVHNLKVAIKISQEIKELKAEMIKAKEKLPIACIKIHPN